MDSSLSGDDIADQLRSSSPPSMFASRQQINDRTLNHSNSTVSNGFGLEELAKARIGFQAIKSTTSSGFSFADQSDDEAETTQQQIDDSPSDVKRVRRMISNRESARRSRRRKQDHLTQLEQQVSQVKVENSAVLKSLTDISQKYNEAAVDNRVLKANVETLRAKVKMAEESVKRVTGLSNPLFQAMSTIMMPGSFSGFPFESSPTTMPNHDGTNMLDVLLPMENVMIQQNPGDKIGRS